MHHAPLPKKFSLLNMLTTSRDMFFVRIYELFQHEFQSKGNEKNNIELTLLNDLIPFREKELKVDIYFFYCFIHE